MGIFKHIGKLLKGEGHLCLAAYEGDLEKCMKLFVMGSNINEVDGHGNSPLYVAASGGKYQIVEWLLAQGADPNWEKRGGAGTALHVAARKGHVSVCKLLTAQGTSIENIATARFEAQMAGNMLCAHAMIPIPELVEHEQQEARDDKAEERTVASTASQNQWPRMAVKEGKAQRARLPKGHMCRARNTKLFKASRLLDNGDRAELESCLNSTEKRLASLETAEGRAELRDELLVRSKGEMDLETAWKEGVIQAEYKALAERIVKGHERWAPGLTSQRKDGLTAPSAMARTQIEEQLEERFEAMESGERENPWKLRENENGSNGETEHNGLPTLAAVQLMILGREKEAETDFKAAFITYEAARRAGRRNGEEYEPGRKAAHTMLGFHVTVELGINDEERDTWFEENRTEIKAWFEKAESIAKALQELELTTKEENEENGSGQQPTAAAQALWTVAEEHEGEGDYQAAYVHYTAAQIAGTRNGGEWAEAEENADRMLDLWMEEIPRTEDLEALVLSACAKPNSLAEEYKELEAAGKLDLNRWR